MLFSIGQLARRSGLTVKTVRFYSDRGLVPPTDRTPAGDRRYDSAALARLELVRTLRELGLDLRTIRQVVDRERSLPEVAALHAEALELRIRTLRRRQAVLTAVAARRSTPGEMDVLHKLATLSATERQALTSEFLASVFDGHEGFARTLTPELPDNPSPDQVDAWISLAELTRDPTFRARFREIAQHHAADRADRAGPPGVRRDPVAAVRDLAGEAAASGLDPAAPAADRTVAAVTADYAHVLGHPDDDALRHRLLARLEAANDPRRECYERHLSVINGWPPPQGLTPVLDWFIRALRARTPGAS